MDEVLPRLKEELDRRIAKGWETYGRPLATFDGRDTDWDAYEEVLGLCLYMTKKVMEDEVRNGRRSGTAYHCPGCTCDIVGAERR